MVCLSRTVSPFAQVSLFASCYKTHCKTSKTYFATAANNWTHARQWPRCPSVCSRCPRPAIAFVWVLVSSPACWFILFECFVRLASFMLAGVAWFAWNLAERQVAAKTALCLGAAHVVFHAIWRYSLTWQVGSLRVSWQAQCVPQNEACRLCAAVLCLAIWICFGTILVSATICLHALYLNLRMTAFPILFLTLCLECFWMRSFSLSNFGFRFCVWSFLCVCMCIFQSCWLTRFVTLRRMHWFEQCAAIDALLWYLTMRCSDCCELDLLRLRLARRSQIAPC